MRSRSITIWLGLLSCGTGSVIAALSPSPSLVDLSAEEQNWIAGHPPIRVGLTPAWAPFSYVARDGKEAGIDVDVLKLISERTGLKFEMVPTASWEDTLSRAEKGELDLTTATAQAVGREKTFRFTRPYYKAAAVIVTREGHQEFSHVSLLQDARVAMPRQDILTKAMAERLPSAQVVLADRQDECFEMVARKRADAAVGNVFTASHYLNEHPEMKLQISGVISEFEFPLRLAVRRDLPFLPGILDKGLASISQEEMDNIASKHLRFALEGAHRTTLLRRRIGQVLLGAVLIGALASLWIYFMGKEVRARRRAEAQLRETNRSLEIFSHSISHDLKAPLRAIGGFAQVLQEEHHAVLGPNGQELVDKIVSSTRRMGTLLSDVLAYGQAARTDAPLQALSLDQVVHQLVDEFPPGQREHFHVVSRLPDVLGYPTLLAQCVGNLLSNAIKFVPRERTPDVQIRAEENHSVVKLWVEDNGIGIAPENQQRIFKLFERVPSRDYAGTGIGLAVVAKSVERMGGKFGVESEPGQGSHFWIQLRTAHA